MSLHYTALGPNSLIVCITQPDDVKIFLEIQDYPLYYDTLLIITVAIKNFLGRLVCHDFLPAFHAKIKIIHGIFLVNNISKI